MFLLTVHLVHFSVYIIHFSFGSTWYAPKISSQPQLIHNANCVYCTEGWSDRQMEGQTDTLTSMNSWQFRALGDMLRKIAMTSGKLWHRTIAPECFLTRVTPTRNRILLPSRNRQSQIRNTVYTDRPQDLVTQNASTSTSLIHCESEKTGPLLFLL